VLKLNLTNKSTLKSFRHRKYTARFWLPTILIGLLTVGTACEYETPDKLKSNPYKKLFKKPGTHTKEKLPYQTLAKVNFNTITTPLLELHSNQTVKNTKAEPETKENRLNKLIEIVILAQKAKQLKLHKTVAIREKLKLQSLRLLAQSYLKVLRHSIVITEADLERDYLKNYKYKDNREYKTRHIVVKTKKEAVIIIRQLTQGMKFKQLAKEKSIAPSASFGGALEWFRVENVNPKFAKTVRSMRQGETSHFPIKTTHGWHVIVLEETRSASPPKFREIKQIIFNKLLQKKIAKKIKKLKANSNITLNKNE